ncbi:hypothetical protein AB9E07_10250 [Rhizobium leguminosarum]
MMIPLLEKAGVKVVATEDQIIPPALQRDQVKSAKATGIHVPPGHVAMLSHAREVADLIVKHPNKTACRASDDI